MVIAYDVIFESPPLNAQDVSDQLRRAIADGRLQYGDRLPTIRQIMTETGLPYGTINRALSALADEGILVSRKRGGTLVNVPRKQSALGHVTRLNAYALVIPELNIGFYPNLVKSFETSASQVGRRMIACASNNDIHKQGDILVQLMAEGISGVALLPVTSGPPPRHQVQMLHKQQIPLVLLHRGVDGVRAPQLTFPADEIGQMAGRAMLERGHRRIGFVSLQPSAATAGYMRGLRSVVDQAGAQWPESWSYVGDLLSATEVKNQFAPQLTAWLQKILRSKQRPTAFFTSFIPVGELVYLIATRMGLRVPEDLSIVTVGGAQRDGAIAQELATVVVNESFTGNRAIELLEQMSSGQLPLNSNVSHQIQFAFDLGLSLHPWQTC